MKSLFKNKKALTFSYLVKIIIMLVTLGILVWGIPTYINDPASDSQFKLKQAQYDYNCENFNMDCDKIVKNCEDTGEECSEYEEERYQTYVSLKDCDELKDKCSESEKEEWENFKEEFPPELDDDNKSDFVKKKEQTSIDIEKYSDENNLNQHAISAIILTEVGNSNGFDNAGFPIVRFECHIFNGNDKGKKCGKFREWLNFDEDMPCTVLSSKGFSTTKSETDKSAFLEAYKKNPDLAICSTSFGVGQIMGFNYNLAGFETPEDFYKAMKKDKSEQVKAMLSFIINTKPQLKEELKKESPNWKKIAYYYNGENYEVNNYDEKLEDNYRLVITNIGSENTIES